MAGGYYNGKDSVDISELASLDADISDDLIDKLQQQLTDNIEKNHNNQLSAENNIQQPLNVNDDSTLFEEVDNTVSSDKTEQEPLQNIEENNAPNEQKEVSDSKTSQQKEKLEVNQNFDDNFIKKYKAKLQKMAKNSTEVETNSEDNNNNKQESPSNDDNGSIDKVSKGKITEKHLSKELKEYNNSLDFLDGNVKYSKYVIYIDPQNVDFIEGLTVKERKNLINNILRQQDDILIAKKKFRVIQNMFFNIVIAVLIFLATVPIVYYAINASLEATINNHLNAQKNWQVLYKEHGKINKY